jgi:hypothetical protein
MSSAPRAGVGLTETTKLAIRAVPLRAMGRPHSLFGRTGNSKIPADGSLANRKASNSKMSYCGAI